MILIWVCFFNLYILSSVCCSHIVHKTPEDIYEIACTTQHDNRTVLTDMCNDSTDKSIVLS